MTLKEIKDRFGIIGNNSKLNNAIERAVEVASSDLSVLVYGESGVGKEVIPQIIHQNSPRKHGVYIAVNCGAIPEGTIDSELFGHEKGSFTGAIEARKGYFEIADKGTLFLDEVAELPLSTQARLLRVLQSGEFIKVGSSKVQKTDVRVVAATNVDLEEAIALGKFRKDLFYRINAVIIDMPPLRERKEDIHLLFQKFALDYSDRYTSPSIRLAPEAQEILENYDWPGNVRELKSLVDRMSVFKHDRLISAEVISANLKDRKEKKANLPIKTPNGQFGSEGINKEFIYYIMSELGQLRQEVKDLREKVEALEGTEVEDVVYTPIADAPKVDKNDILLHSEEVKSIKDVGADMIKRSLEKHDGKRKAAAQELGISERTLYRKIKELGIE